MGQESQGTAMSRLDEILDEINNGFDFMISDYASNREQEKKLERQKKSELKQAKADIKSLMLEIVGEDEEETAWKIDGMTSVNAERNQLRAELRKEIESL